MLVGGVPLGGAMTYELRLPIIFCCIKNTLEQHYATVRRNAITLLLCNRLPFIFIGLIA
jgi:hypothetical protein